ARRNERQLGGHPMDVRGLVRSRLVALAGDLTAGRAQHCRFEVADEPAADHFLETSMPHAISNGFMPANDSSAAAWSVQMPSTPQVRKSRHRRRAASSEKPWSSGDTA